MVEIPILIKVGMFIKAIVTGGYCLAGGYLAKTGVKYVQDYKDSIARENEVR